MRENEKRDVVNAPIGTEADVESVALNINSGEINAITIAGEPFSTRRQRLIEMIGEIEARMDASERGQDLAPLLEEARNALRIVEAQGRQED